MEELAKFLTSKIGNTLIFILCLFVPGNLFIFLWNRDLYLELDIFRLGVLSITAPCTFFTLFIGLVTNIVIFETRINSKRALSFEEGLSISAIMTFFAINTLNFVKLIGHGIKLLTIGFIGAILFLIVVCTMINAIINIVIYIKRRSTKK